MLDRRLLLLAFPLAAFACFTSDDNSAPMDGGATFPDGSVFDGSVADAAPPFADGAPQDASDAAPADAPADVTIDTAPPTVVVTVLGPNGPESGVTIVFNDPSGAPLITATTGAAGTTTQILEPGSSVTALFGTESLPQLVTVLGVKPGDRLTAYDTSNASITVDITALPAPSPTNTVQYVASAGACSTNFFTPPAEFGADPGCYGATVPLLVLAESEVGGEIGFTYQKAVPFDLDGGGAIPSSFAPWATNEATETVAATNLADGGAAPTAYFNEVVGSIAFGGTGNTDTTAPPGEADTTYETHPGFADFVQAEVTQFTYNSGVTQAQSIATRAAPAAGSATATFDVTQFLPTISSAALDATNPAQPAITVTSSGSLASTSALLVAMSWANLNDAGGLVSGTWVIVGPSTQLTVQAPALPAALAAWAPAGDANFNPAAAAAIQSDMVPSYDTIRQVGLALVPQQLAQGGAFGGDFAVVPPLPVAGTVRVTGIQEGFMAQ